MQITIDTKDSEEDIRKAISMLNKLLEGKEMGMQAELEKMQSDLKAEERKEEMLVMEIADKGKKEDKKKVLSELLDKKEEPRKKDEAFDVEDIVPY